MTFASAIFLFGYLPVFFSIYYITPFKYKSYVIAFASYLFYGWWRLDFLALLLIVTFGNYWVGGRIAHAFSRSSAKNWLIFAIVGDLCVLGYFKYWNFFVDSLADLLNDGRPFSLLIGGVILPIGISFYVFQAISYVIDVYRADAPPAKRLIDFAAFKAMFPQLVAGPVIRYKDIEAQFEHRTHSWELFGQGALRFFSGLAKKVLIADSVAPIADAVFSAPSPTFAETWIGALAYSVQLYFDFSAYSSMAVGLAMMMGFRFIENFRFPYISSSITEFWRRWHISLSTWLREYLYFSLGGNRLGIYRTYINLMLTMVLGGLWHGANWTFILWGLLHGVLLASERALGVTGKEGFIIWRWVPTMVFVILGWVLFRAPDMGVAVQYYAGMFGHNGFGLRDAMAWQISYFGLSMLVIGIALALTEPWLNRVFGIETISEPLKKDKLGPVPLHGAVVVCLLGALAVVKLMADNDSPFLYFQF
ncbi:MBOAT family O-acyltransferase [Devosia psychrophila]|uniref:Probable alginate O-acetylase AlgI n=1 Tax=Devosia psychrophila TaxID=728005 RepID=A0A0F5PZ50_9HYPH|nr:MBOAT family protein [Devosia psychrophila]KKC33957.1 poly(beta-D-mannuronate) O-acetylase [Devosia psychrophila]SFD18134.1 alginate O-acetyltransferase complex protein AlgI [Devosia psychrophila]